MIFQHTIDKVLSGEKTQTRRIVKPNEEYFPVDYDNIPCGVYRQLGSGVYRVVYHGGQTLAVQPARGKPAVARIRILDIGREDVRWISHEDAKAEGFSSKDHFWLVWTGLHDKPIYNKAQENESTITQRMLLDRPAARYDAWVLMFELTTAAA